MKIDTISGKFKGFGQCKLLSQIGVAKGVLEDNKCDKQSDHQVHDQ